MKKGFTMIELIFVIVILGILASVAVPRLAGTKADAEISAAVANLRTLISDANTYLVAKGEFPGSTAKWSEITNVPLASAADTAPTSDANLKVGKDSDCIKVKMVNKDANKPAHIVFTPKSGATGVCKDVLDSASVKAYLDSKISYTEGGAQKTISSAMPIGSSIKLER